MRQGLITGPRTFAIQEVPKPRLQSADEVLLRTAASGICSGDLMEWYLERKIHTVLGHEVVGQAVEVGENIQHVRGGQLIFAHHHAPCMACRFCRAGDHVQCATWRKTRLDPGGMAEYIRVPAENALHDTFPIDDLDAETGIFIEPLACSVKAWQRLESCPRQVGAVIGCGVMGLLNLAVARAFGAETLWAVEPEADRRQRAREFGAHEAYSPDELTRRALAPGFEGADFVIVGPGSSHAILESLAYVRPGGTIVLFTPTPDGVTTALDLGQIYFRDVRLVPSYSCGPDHTRTAYELLRSGRVDVKPLITHRYGLNDLQQAYETAKGGGGALKVVVTFE